MKRIRRRTDDPVVEYPTHYREYSSGAWGSLQSSPYTWNGLSSLEYSDSYMIETRRAAIAYKQRKLLLDKVSSYNDVDHDTAKGGSIFAIPGIAYPVYEQEALDGGSVDAINFAPTGTHRSAVWPNRMLREEANAYLTNNGGYVPHQIDHIHESIFPNGTLPRSMHIDRNPFESEFSVWFVLADLISFKSLFRRLLTQKSRLTSFRNVGIDREATARSLANTNLAVQYGLIPTIADLQEFIRQIKTWKDKYDKVGELMKKRFGYHSKKDISDMFPPLVWDFDLDIDHPSHATCAFRFHVEQRTTARWHGMALYGFTCPEFQGWLTRIKQIVDSFGILDPSAIWDVIPFSFVLDWFFSISSWLNKNKPQLFPATPVIYDYLESVRLDTVRTYTVTYWAPTESGYQKVSRKFWGDRYVSYSRKRFRPPPNYVLMSSGLNVKRSFFSWNRLSIASSLVAQRLPR